MKRFFRRTILVSFATVLLFVVHSAFSIWSFSSKNELVKTEAAIVLGAAVWDKEPSPVLRERINHAIWLYETGYVDKLIFTGGTGNGDRYAESEIARDYAIKNDVDPSDILIETKSVITEENLKYAYEVAKTNNLSTFTLVSDPLHMKRSIVMAEHMGMEVCSSPTETSAYQTMRSKLPFFFRELFFYIGYLVTLPFR